MTRLPTLEVVRALAPLCDAFSATARGLSAVRPAQMSDAIRSARDFLDQAEAALAGEEATAARATAFDGIHIAIDALRTGLMACAHTIGPKAENYVARAHDKVIDEGRARLKPKQITKDGETHEPT